MKKIMVHGLIGILLFAAAAVPLNNAGVQPSPPRQDNLTAPGETITHEEFIKRIQARYKQIREKNKTE